MCDYSLHAVSSRAAELAETLVSTGFAGTQTHGFASPADPTVAVCLRPGTELVFEEDVCAEGSQKKINDRLARFRQIAVDRPGQHHDALEFANGAIVLLTDLVVGQKAKVLQLPVDPAEKPAEKTAELARPMPSLTNA